MRKVVCHKLGDATLPFDAPDCPLRLEPDAPRQNLKPGTVRVKIAAAALNFADALQVKGTYQEKPPLPFVPASECSGVVTAVSRPGCSWCCCTRLHMFMHCWGLYIWTLNCVWWAFGSQLGLQSSWPNALSMDFFCSG